MTHKYEVGDRVEVVANVTGHEFDIGEIVTIEREDRYHYKCSNGYSFWFLSVSEIRPFWQSEWRLVENYSDIDRDDVDVAFNDGEPVAYRVKPDVVKDVERRVGFTGHNWDNWNIPNATLRGQTRNGKPIGVWTIEMDDVP